MKILRYFIFNHRARCQHHNNLYFVFLTLLMRGWAILRPELRETKGLCDSHTRLELLFRQRILDSIEVTFVPLAAFLCLSVFAFLPLRASVWKYLKKFLFDEYYKVVAFIFWTNDLPINKLTSKNKAYYCEEDHW